MILFLLASSFALAAAPCELKWEAAKNEFSSISLLRAPKDCNFPEGSLSPCFITEASKSDGTKARGATAIRAHEDINSYCLKSEVDLFGYSRPHYPQALVKCEKGKAKKILLVAPDKKGTRECDLPQF